MMRVCATAPASGNRLLSSESISTPVVWWCEVRVIASGACAMAREPDGAQAEHACGIAARGANTGRRMRDRMAFESIGGESGRSGRKGAASCFPGCGRRRGSARFPQAAVKLVNGQLQLASVFTEHSM
ncbi:protein of unknown function [Burkholderia multivorans]